MIVYGDLLFLINFSMDFLCFYIACLLLHKRIAIFRTCLASVIGGIYSVAALFIKTQGGIALFLDISVLAFMCAIVFATKNTSLWWMLKAIFLYFVISALLGGGMTALYSLFNRMNLLNKDMNMDDGIDVWIFALLALLGSVVTLNGGRIFRVRNSIKEVKLELENESQRVVLRALVDSGNLAIEPISGKAVAFVRLEACKGTLSNEEYEYLCGKSDLAQMPLHIVRKIRLIPSRTLSGEAYLPAMRFKRVALVSGKRKKELDIYVAFVNDDALSGYDAIISQEILV